MGNFKITYTLADGSQVQSQREDTSQEAVITHLHGRLLEAGDFAVVQQTSGARIIVAKSAIAKVAAVVAEEASIPLEMDTSSEPAEPTGEDEPEDEESEPVNP